MVNFKSQSIQTYANSFGIYRMYIQWPTYDPDMEVTNAKLLHIGNNEETMADSCDEVIQLENADILPLPSYFSFANYSTYILSLWYYQSKPRECSANYFDTLCKIVSALDFQPMEVKGFNAAK